MINQPDTIYEIRYDFDLDGAEISIPEGCILKFNGGRFLNALNIKGDVENKYLRTLTFQHLSMLLIQWK